MQNEPCQALNRKWYSQHKSLPASTAQRWKRGKSWSISQSIRLEGGVAANGTQNSGSGYPKNLLGNRHG